MPRPWPRPAPRARRALTLPLQFHPIAQGLAVRARDQDAGDAGRSREQAIGLARHLHGVRSPSACCCGGRARLRYDPAHRICRRRAADALLAVGSKTGCLINSERRKHPLQHNWLRDRRRRWTTVRHRAGRGPLHRAATRDGCGRRWCHQRPDRRELAPRAARAGADPLSENKPAHRAGDWVRRALEAAAREIFRKNPDAIWQTGARSGEVDEPLGRLRPQNWLIRRVRG